MSLPPHSKEAIRALVDLLKTLVWWRLTKRLSACARFLSRPFLRILYLWRTKLNHRQSRKEPSSPKRYRKDTTSSDECLPTYTIILDGQTFPLDNIAASSYPFAGGSIRRNPSRTSLFDHTRTETPVPPSSLHSREGSVYNISIQGQTDSQIELRNIPPPPRNPHRQDSEVPVIHVEYDNRTNEPYSPSGSAIEECPASHEMDQSSAWNVSRDHLGIPPSSAASTHSRRSSTRPGSGGSSTRSGSRGSSTMHGWDLDPTFPKESLRYERRTKIVPKEVNLTLDAVDFDYESFEMPPGWERFAHPEGCCYFYNESKRIFTDVEIYDPMQRTLVEERIQMIEDLEVHENFPEDADIVLNIHTNDDGTRLIRYYCINHAKRAVFFFTEFPANWLATWGEVKGAFSKNHLRYEIEAQYWCHISMYPHRVVLKKALVDELRDIVLHLIGDTMTSVYSTSAFTLEDLQKILSVLSAAKESIESNYTAGVVCVLARFMYMFYHNRFLNFHGESYARIERDFSVYGHALHPRSPFLRSLSLLLFSAPDVHLKNLQKMWVDKILHQAVWQQTLSKFLTEWQELVTAASILLNANVAFLAIQSVDHDPPTRSWAQILSYASVVANVGGMILGLLLIRQHRNIKQETSEHVHKFLKDHDSKELGLEALAVMFSLPHALLMWGMVLFLCAFTLMCTQSAPSDARFVVGISLTFCGLLILCCIWLNWQTNEPDTSEKNRTPAYTGNLTDENDTCSVVPSQPQDGRTSATLTGGNSASDPADTVLPSKGTTSVHSTEQVAHSSNVLISTVSALLQAFQCLYLLPKESRRRREAHDISV